MSPRRNRWAYLFRWPAVCTGRRRQRWGLNRMAFAVTGRYNRGRISGLSTWGSAAAMPSDGSVTRWLGALQAGDPAAAQQLWERYFQRLVALARAGLQGAPRRA